MDRNKSLRDDVSTIYQYLYPVFWDTTGHEHSLPFQNENPCGWDWEQNGNKNYGGDLDL